MVVARARGGTVPQELRALGEVDSHFFHGLVLRCKTCMKTFSENRGTPLFRLRLPYEKLREVLTSLARCGSIRRTADTVGVNKNTVERIVKLAGRHTKRFNDFMLRDLRMHQVQCDEFWTYVKSKKGAKTSMAPAKMRSVARKEIVVWGEVRLSSPEPGDEAVGHEARRRKRERRLACGNLRP